jgi:hypothetical protein
VLLGGVLLMSLRMSLQARLSPSARNSILTEKHCSHLSIAMTIR